MSQLKRRIKIYVYDLLSWIDKILRRFGLSLVRIRERRVGCDMLTDGRSLIYKTGLDPVISELPLKRTRILAHPLTKGSSSHINFLALDEALRSDEKSKRLNIVENRLKEYCEFHKKNPQSLARMFAMDQLNYPEPGELPPWFFVYPWSDTRDLTERVRMKNFSTFLENVNRKGPAIDAYEGGAQHHPTDMNRATFEARLLHNLLCSIEKKGYRPTPGYHDPIGADLMVESADNWCWIVSGGIHRCCVLSALEYEKVDVVIKTVIYRDDVADWPNVRNGLFSEELALMVFDRIVAGNPGKLYENWIEERFNLSADSKRV